MMCRVGELGAVGGRVQLLMKTGQLARGVGLFGVFQISQAAFVGGGVDLVFVYQVVIPYYRH